MRQDRQRTNGQFCSPWFLLLFFCYYVPFWGGTFWFFASQPPDATMPLTSFFAWVALLAIMLGWAVLGFGGIAVATLGGEALRQAFDKRHRQRAVEDQQDDEFEDSWPMLDDADFALAAQDDFARPISPAVAVDESESAVNALLPDELSVD